MTNEIAAKFSREGNDAHAAYLDLPLLSLT